MPCATFLLGSLRESQQKRTTESVQNRSQAQAERCSKQSKASGCQAVSVVGRPSEVSRTGVLSREASWDLTHGPLFRGVLADIGRCSNRHL